MSRAAKRSRARVAAPHAAPVGSWRATWDESRIAWIALAVLVAVTLARAVTIGFMPDDIGVLDSVSRGGPQRLLAGVIPGLHPETITRDLGFWWWGTVLGLRATGFHVIALVCVLAASGGDGKRRR